MTLTSVRLPTTVVGSYPVVKGSGGFAPSWTR